MFHALRRPNLRAAQESWTFKGGDLRVPPCRAIATMRLLGASWWQERLFGRRSNQSSALVLYCEAVSERNKNNCEMDGRRDLFITM